MRNISILYYKLLGNIDRESQGIFEGINTNNVAQVMERLIQQKKITKEEFLQIEEIVYRSFNPGR